MLKGPSNELGVLSVNFAIRLDKFVRLLKLGQKTQARDDHGRVAELILNVFTLFLPIQRLKLLQDKLCEFLGANLCLVRQIQTEVGAGLSHFLLEVGHLV